MSACFPGRLMLVGRIVRTPRRRASVVVVATVASVHENMEQRTGQDDQPRQPPQQVRSMLGDQVEGADGEETPERYGCSGGPPRRMIVVARLSRIACHIRCRPFWTEQLRLDVADATAR